MNFKIQVTTARGVDWDFCKPLILNLEKFVNTKLKKQTFGSSIETFHYGFEIYPYESDLKMWFDKTKSIRKYSPKNKYLLSVGQIDWNIFKNLNDKERFNIVAQSILDSIDRLDSLKKKPKEFNILEFRDEINNILKEYNKE